jgi:Ca2+-binding RTX toxin-like protein
MGSSTVTLGSGNDVVNLTGYNNVINARGSTGNDTIMAGMGSETVTTGSGNDTITLAGYYNVVNTDGGMNFITGGSGDDTFALPTAGQGFDTITSFLPSYGDKLDVSAALTAAGWSTGLTLSNYLQVTESGSTATLSIVPGGSGSPVAIAQLDGFTNLTLASLQSHLIL